MNRKDTSLPVHNVINDSLLETHNTWGEERLAVRGNTTTLSSPESPPLCPVNITEKCSMLLCGPLKHNYCMEVGVICQGPLPLTDMAISLMWVKGSPPPQKKKNSFKLFEND